MSEIKKKTRQEKFEEIIADSKRMLAIDPSALDDSSRKTPDIFNHFLAPYLEEEEFLKHLKDKTIEIRRDLWIYYSGKADPEVYKKRPFDMKIMKNNLDMFIESDPEMKKHKAKIYASEKRLSALKLIIKQIENRSYQITNTRKTMEFKEGN